MNEPTKSLKVHLVEQLGHAVRKLAAQLGDSESPAEAVELLAGLESVQAMLGAIYTDLANAQEARVQRAHHAVRGEPSTPDNPAPVRADLALDEAAQYGTDAAAALGRAREAVDVSAWFDEIEVDGGS
ncbi:MAG TPA: hypothetical protein VFQ74_07900 [Pseudolysinimonas sp.]|nr:hypothetical protein [Pseudolysinimonas sp.]